MSKKKPEKKKPTKEKASSKTMVKTAPVKKERTALKSKNGKHADPVAEKPEKGGKALKAEKAEKGGKEKRGKDASGSEEITPLTRLAMIKVRHEALKREIDQMLEADDDEDAGGTVAAGGEEE